MNQLKLIKRVGMSAIVLILLACGGGSSSSDTIPVNPETISTETNTSTTYTSDKKVFIIGDSTVYPDTNVAPEAFGWGSKMANYAVNPSNIINRAVGGASSKSYIEISGERSWEDTKSRILAADTSNGAYLLIQFGHNDAAIDGADNMNSYQTLAGVGDTYYTYLKVYIDWARAHDITPVLVTPPLRRYYQLPDSIGTHVITDVGTYEPIGDYPETMRILAATEGVILIDLTARTILEFEKYSYADLGTEFFIDNNHWHEAGAVKIAGFVVDEICATDAGLCAQFNP